MKNQNKANVTYIAKHVGELKIHPNVQRFWINRSKIEKFKNDIDLDAIGPIHVVRYTINGVTALWVIDGQHRIIALIELELTDVVVNVELHHDVKDDAAAARLCKKLNTRSPWTNLDMFRVEVVGGDPISSGAATVLSAHGLKVDSATSTKSLRCAATVKKLFKWGVLDEVIGIVHRSCGNDIEAHDGKFLEGVGLVLHQFNGDLDRKAFEKIIAKFPGGPRKIIGSARGLMEFDKSSIPARVAKVLLHAYNKGRSTGKLTLA